MTRFTSPRFFLAIGLVAALSVAVVAQQRSTATANLKTESGELFVDVAEGQVVDWRVSIELT